MNIPETQKIQPPVRFFSVFDAEDCIAAQQGLYDVETEMVEVVKGVELPLHVFESDSMPRDLPKKRALVVFVCCSHNDGWPYEWRFVAVPLGSIVKGREVCGNNTVITENKRISFVDCNAKYSFYLPSGSWEYRCGKWELARQLDYEY